MATLTIGLMSGTSMDGIDAAVVRWRAGDIPETLAAETFPIDEALRSRLRRLGPESPLSSVADCDAILAEAFAAAALAVSKSAGIAPASVDAIGSHGQTIWHAPDRDPPASIQIGDPNRIAERTGMTVVSDFRRRDLAAGGQGAPLAPLFHAALFPGTSTRAIVNIGGIANVSWIGGGSERTVSGFDIGPGNTLLDACYREHHPGGAAFDRDGHWASTARADEALLQRLMGDPFFTRRPPKSTGPEHFNMAWLQQHGAHRHAGAVVQATLLELTARTIADALSHSPGPAQQILICGGGAANAALMRRLAEHCAPLPVQDTGAVGVDPDYVEAVGFAWLARQALAGARSSLPTVTGCRHPVPLGSIHPG